MKLKPPNNNAATRVMEALRSKGVTQQTVAEILGVKSCSISLWKRAKDGHSGKVPAEHRGKLRVLCTEVGVKWRKGDL